MITVISNRERIGNWIQTYTGLKIYPLDPRPEEICIEDIAHALSNICRFTGHCREFYSVAQHSVFVSSYVCGENSLWGLLHDASEAYLCDIARPIKTSTGMEEYCQIEQTLMQVIAEKFELPWPIPEEVKQVDNEFLMTEAYEFGMLTSDWHKYAEPLNIRIVPKNPKIAKYSFFTQFERLMLSRA
jgi:uncharacterized protein